MRFNLRALRALRPLISHLSTPPPQKKLGVQTYLHPDIASSKRVIFSPLSHSVLVTSCLPRLGWLLLGILDVRGLSKTALNHNINTLQFRKLIKEFLHNSYVFKFKIILNEKPNHNTKKSHLAKHENRPTLRVFNMLSQRYEIIAFFEL